MTVTRHGVVGLDGRSGRQPVARSTAAVSRANATVDPPSTAILDLLGDAYARAILLATVERPMSAKELTRELDMSQPTVSRRLGRLKELGLVVEVTRLDPAGHHASVYRSAVDELTVCLDDGCFAVRVERHQDPSDRMTYLWQQLRRE